MERNGGELDHSWLQKAILLYFAQVEQSLGVLAFPELRVQVNSTRFRVPDITVMHGRPGEQILTSPPFICIEISPEDSMTSMQERIDDYLTFGVKNSWIIDPRHKQAFGADSAGIHEASQSVLRAIGEPGIGQLQMDLAGMWPAF